MSELFFELAKLVVEVASAIGLLVLGLGALVGIVALCEALATRWPVLVLIFAVVMAVVNTLVMLAVALQIIAIPIALVVGIGLVTYGVMQGFMRDGWVALTGVFFALVMLLFPLLVGLAWELLKMLARRMRSVRKVT